MFRYCAFPPAERPQLADRLGPQRAGGIPRDGIAFGECLTQRQRGDAQHHRGHGAADGAGEHRFHAEIQPSVHAGEHELRRCVLHDVAQAHRGAVAGGAGDAEAPGATLGEPQRVMQADRVGLAALIVFGCDDPDLVGNLGGDFLQHFHAGSVDPIVVRQHHPIQHREHSLLRPLFGPVASRWARGQHSGKGKELRPCW